MVLQIWHNPRKGALSKSQGHNNIEAISNCLCSRTRTERPTLYSNHKYNKRVLERVWSNQQGSYGNVERPRNDTNPPAVACNTEQVFNSGSKEVSEAFCFVVCSFSNSRWSGRW